MRRIEVKQGSIFGRLTFVGLAGSSSEGRRLGNWLCKCGQVCVKALGRVKSGKIRSCGCLVPDAVKAANTRHGWRYTREYRIWRGMISRCTNTKLHDYPRYGGRGIKVCERWLKFQNFIFDMGPCPSPVHSIDRMNGDGNYDLNNCRWATPQQQRRNIKDFVLIDSPYGRMPLVDYAKAIGITRGAAALRLKRGKLEGCGRCR